MSKTTEILKTVLNNFNKSIKDAIDSKGLNTTGKAKDSLRIEVKETLNKVNGKSIGVDYLEVLNTGRGPGKFPPIDAIKKWTENKPVDVVPFLVGRKIALEGTEIFKDNAKGIQLTILVARAEKELVKNIAVGIAFDFQQKLNKFADEFNAKQKSN